MVKTIQNNKYKIKIKIINWLKVIANDYRMTRIKWEKTIIKWRKKFKKGKNNHKNKMERKKNNHKMG